MNNHTTHEIEKKDIKLVWDKKEEEAFSIYETKFMWGTHWSLLDGMEDFVLYMMQRGLGGCLCKGVYVSNKGL